MVILDTNVISELMSGQIDEAVAKWLESLDSESIFLNSISLFETEYGLNLLPRGKRRARLIEKFQYIKTQYIILNFDDTSAVIAAEFLVQKISEGFNNLEADMMIAGICAANDAILATRNSKDFEGLPIRVVNPWK